MATRNPTAFTTYLDEGLFLPRQGIRAAEIDKVLDDQEYILDMQQMIVSAAFWPLKYTGASYTTKRTIKVDIKDMCSVSAADIDNTCYVFARTTTGSSATVQLEYSGVDDATFSGITTTSYAWAGPQTLTIETNGAENVIAVKGRVDSGGGDLYVAGILIVSDET